MGLCMTHDAVRTQSVCMYPVDCCVSLNMQGYCVVCTVYDVKDIILQVTKKFLFTLLTQCCLTAFWLICISVQYLTVSYFYFNPALTELLLGQAGIIQRQWFPKVCHHHLMCCFFFHICQNIHAEKLKRQKTHLVIMHSHLTSVWTVSHVFTSLLPFCSALLLYFLVLLP